MNLAESCRHWAAEMHKAASVVEEQGDGSVECLRIIDGNRAIASTLEAAAEALDAAPDRVKTLALMVEAGLLASTALMAVDYLRKQGDLVGWCVHADNLAFFVDSTRSAIRELEESGKTESVAGGIA